MKIKLLFMVCFFSVFTCFSSDQEPSALDVLADIALGKLNSMSSSMPALTLLNQTATTGYIAIKPNPCKRKAEEVEGDIYAGIPVLTPISAVASSEMPALLYLPNLDYVAANSTTFAPFIPKPVKKETNQGCDGYQGSKLIDSFNILSDGRIKAFFNKDICECTRVHSATFPSSDLLKNKLPSSFIRLAYQNGCSSGGFLSHADEAFKEMKTSYSLLGPESVNAHAQASTFKFNLKYVDFNPELHTYTFALVTPNGETTTINYNKASNAWESVLKNLFKKHFSSHSDYETISNYTAKKIFKNQVDSFISTEDTRLLAQKKSFVQ